MSPEPRIVLLLLAVLLFPRSEAIAAPRKFGLLERSEDPQLSSICKKTDYADICFSTIKPLLRGHKANLMLALKAEIGAASVMFRSAKHQIEKVSNNPSSSKTMKDNLSVCSESYDSALDSLQSSLQAIAGRDRGTLSSELSAVITYIETCNDAFVERPSARSPVSTVASKLSKIGSNCLAIAQQVHL
ncbi:hypothetical protein SAY87_003539 [Trapa incisa]|uniref:Pectinesterase inhibitor domain-containing protein n=1 Tax=Trapa incisa TaxID=236973 RepID=A0AAN7KPG3_9MYRT|nr:hypothetical protein SAY87_003539 [Trapa incisa]